MNLDTITLRKLRALNLVRALRAKATYYRRKFFSSDRGMDFAHLSIQREVLARKIYDKYVKGKTE